MNKLQIKKTLRDLKAKMIEAEMMFHELDSLEQDPGNKLLLYRMGDTIQEGWNFYDNLEKGLTPFLRSKVS